VLNGLQKSHLLTVPFENLDIHCGRRIDLKQTYTKIVERNRGGFCYELNGLFFELLKSIGFKAKLVSARVYDKNTGFGQEFDHMVIIVTINGNKYLTDVGFGEFAFYPLKIELDKLLEDPRGKFKISIYDNTYLLVSKIEENESIPQYLFSEIERQPEDFYEMCVYHQTSPDSHFTQKRICSLPTENGRITISGNTLKITVDKNVTERILTDKDDFNKALWNYFKIKI
jgi:N-hydroxyarylamine O-acetyltransferase